MIKWKCGVFLSILLLSLLMSSFVKIQQDPWKPEQLMAPADLAALIKQHTNIPLIISIGPGALIQGSIDIGPANDKANLEKLKTLLDKQDKNKEIVIYCGCCPFKNCPNVRPAFALLKEMNFTGMRLLNLSHNIKVDWLNQGYPVQDLK
jgi:thiosulfate/3-mercaptopyruvate sulfurtransferase